MGMDIADVPLVRTDLFTPEQLEAARQAVALRARDDEDRSMLLQMLGLVS